MEILSYVLLGLSALIMVLLFWFFVRINVAMSLRQEAAAIIFTWLIKEAKENELFAPDPEFDWYSAFLLDTDAIMLNPFIWKVQSVFREKSKYIEMTQSLEQKDFEYAAEVMRRYADF